MSADSALMTDAQQPHPSAITLPAIPALVADSAKAVIFTEDGEVKTISHEQASLLVHKKPVMVCHAGYTGSKIETKEFSAFDILELYAFVHPARFCTPTINGIAHALGMQAPADMEDQAMVMPEIVQTLLTDLRNDPLKAKADPLEIAKVMGLNGKGWVWTPFICLALGENYDEAAPINGKKALAVWENLPEWAEEPPPPPPSHFGVSTGEAEERLEKLRGHDAEERLEQREYSAQIAMAFQPIEGIKAKDPQDDIENEDRPPPHVVLAEAGTGIGKTLGYLAPASVWAEKNGAPVWISTYTKNLQRQIDSELDRLYPDATLKDRYTAIRKGRENYLCLLNFEDIAAAASLARTRNQAIGAGIMARWIAASKDGDLSGTDFPGWISGLLGYQYTTGLADKRGECIYSACSHYHQCFVERSTRKAARARIVVGNHALSMINAAIASPNDTLPQRYVFDEGHHLFNAADSAFSAHLTAQETQDLRRWIRGAEGGRKSRARGLKKRAEEILADDIELQRLLEDIIMGAECLTSHGWRKRMSEGAPLGVSEQFLHSVYAQVQARAQHRHSLYSIETPVHPLDDTVKEKAFVLLKALRSLQKPMLKLAQGLEKKIAEDDGEMNADTRRRIEAVSVSLRRRAQMTLQSWIGMLDNILHDADGDNAPNTIDNQGFVDWMQIEKIEGRSIDVGLYRHYVDPMKPFAAALLPHVHGMAITSATLRDGTPNWESARIATGANYFTLTPMETYYSSPFHYAKQARVIVLQDVNKNDLAQVSGAFRALFTASQGGALGLFTAVNRLRAVRGEIAAQLESEGLKLYAQHIDEIDAGTLIDIFRAEENACLLGTDAIRDGVDVPGKSLRLIAFDRVPWPRPDLLHKARRDAFGGRRYDEMITRLKLKQAFGRLIRKADDKGVFVMLDSALPSRLYDAFPETVAVQKLGLKDAINEIKDFL